MDFRASLEALVRAALRDLAYTRLYPGRVERDNGDGSVDLMPEAAEFSGTLGLQHVKVRFGVAGASARIEPGTRCLFGFEDGSPRRPYVAEWGYAQRSATVSLDGGVAAVARKGDLVDVHLSGAPAGTPVSGYAVGAIQPPGAVPPIPLVPGAPNALIKATLIAPVPVRAVILGGAPKVKA